MNSGEKRYIPHTNPKWDMKLPDGMDNSLVTKDGRNHDDGYNFDEHDNDREDELEADIERTGWDDIAENS